MAQLDSQQDRYAQSPDLIKALMESLGSMGVNAVGDATNAIEMAAKNPDKWLASFLPWNDETAEDYGNIKDAMRARYPQPEVSQGTKQIQDAMIEPVVDYVAPLANTYAANNPAVRDSIRDEINDPTNQHLAENAIVAAPLFGRLFNAFLDAPDFGDTLRGSGGGNQKGAIVWHGSKEALDSFDNTKAGTGDGAKLFGVGTNLAEDQSIASRYMPEGGSMHEVDLPDEAIATMLDWDKKIPDQPEATRGILKANEQKILDAMYSDTPLDDFHSGGAVYNKLVTELRGDENAAKFLNDLGIKGTQVLDPNSRFRGEGTRNFTVFDDQLPKIVSRNGKPINDPNSFKPKYVRDYHLEDWQKDTGLTPQQIDDYAKTGDLQRGAPEIAMVNAQAVLGGGVLPNQLEHIGDISNRASPMHGLDWGRETAADKAQKGINELKSGYGFGREHRENMSANARSKGISLEEHEKNVNDALKTYADEHRKLPVYNVVQKHSRDAAVKLAEGDYDGAISDLEEVVRIASDRPTYLEAMKGYSTDPAKEVFQKDNELNLLADLVGEYDNKQRGSINMFGSNVDTDAPIDPLTMVAAALSGDTNLRREAFPNIDKQKFHTMYRPTAKEYAYEMGMRHKLGGTTENSAGTKLNTPVQEMSRIVSSTGNPLPTKEFDVNQLRGQSVHPLFGDQSQAATNLWGINNNMFDEPVRLTGGHEWWRENAGEIWAGDNSAIGKLLKQINAAHDMDQDMFGIYTPMHMRSSNFNDMTTNAMMHGIKGLDIDAPTKNAFDDAIRGKWKFWTSIDDPMMDIMLKENGNARKAFVDAAGQKRFTEAGFPSLEDAIYAVNDPSLADVPKYWGGQHVGKADGSSVIKGEGVYNNTLGGEPMGAILKPIPPQLIYRDHSDYLDEMGIFNQNARDRSFYLAHPQQYMSNEIVDDILRYLEN